MKKVGVLGNGWLGRQISSFLNDYYQVKFSNRTIDNDLDLNSCQVDLTDKTRIHTEFFNVDYLIVTINSKEIEHYKMLLSFIPENCKVIFTSSTSVYSYSWELIHENSCLNKGGALAEIEKLLSAELGSRLTVLRLAGLYGKNRSPKNFLKSNTIKRSNQVVNMLHGDDAVNVYAKIIEKDLFGEIFNVCSDHHPTRKAFYSFWRKDKLEFETDELTPKEVSSEKIIRLTGVNFRSVLEN